MQSFGHKTGSGAPASAQDIALDRKERLRRLAIETVDLSKDPYLHRNHVGKIECRLCLTLHLNEASYLTHTQGRKHQTNLARRAAKEQQMMTQQPPPPPPPAAVQPSPPPSVATQTAAPPASIGRPGYRVTKIRDSKTKQLGFRVEIDYRECSEEPRFKFVNSWEQKVEAVDSESQYIVFVAPPYDTIGFKIQNIDIDSNHLLRFWDLSNKIYLLQFLFKKDDAEDAPA